MSDKSKTPASHYVEDGMSDIKETQPYTHSGFVILNHVGTIWTPEVFDTPEEAQAYIDRSQRENPRMDLSKHKVIPGHAKVYGFVEVAPAPLSAGRMANG